MEATEYEQIVALIEYIKGGEQNLLADIRDYEKAMRKAMNNGANQETMDLLNSIINRNWSLVEMCRTVHGLAKQLLKHRKEKKNTERDTAIFRMHLEKKTAGEIAKLLSIRGKNPDRVVTAAISRERKRLKNQ